MRSEVGPEPDIRSIANYCWVYDFGRGLGRTYARRHPLPVLGQCNEAARVHHASSCRGWDLAVGAASIPSNDNSLMRQRHFAR